MRILYSKPSIQVIRALPERQMAKMLWDIKGVLQYPPIGDIKPLPGFSDHRKILYSHPYHVIYKKVIYKGKEVLYILEVLTDEELEYYTS